MRYLLRNEHLLVNIVKYLIRAFYQNIILKITTLNSSLTIDNIILFLIGIL